MIIIKNKLGVFYIKDTHQSINELRSSETIKCEDKNGKTVTLFGDIIYNSEFSYN
jgi:hypothetical protein